MRFTSITLKISRLFTAMTLLVGPASPVYAGFASAPSSSYKDAAAVLPGGAQTTKTAQPRTAANLKMPLYFEANRGQTDASVKFFTRAAGYNLYLTGSEAVTVLPQGETGTARPSAVVRMKLKGANANPLALGQDILPGRTSYFFGSDSSKWQTGVEQYNKVKFGQVYPGIDMVYRFDKGNVEYDFVLAPGANPWRILMGFEGAKGLRLDPKGNLVLNVEGGELTYKAPQLYQTLGAKRVSVKGRFVLAANNHVRFEVGNYIKSKELVIDPQIAYSTYLGGSVEDKINAIAVDKTKQVYVTGYSISIPNDFPATTPATGHTSVDPAFADAAVGNHGGKDVFVAKLSADGTKLLWLAWLGGNLSDVAKGIALQITDTGTPNVYITGETASKGTGTSFPVFPGTGLQACETNISGTLAFVAKLEQPGDVPALVYSTCWGGVSGGDTNTGNAIAVGSDGAAYVTGTTESSLFPHAGAVAPYNARGGAFNGFVFKITATGSGVQYSRFLGPTSGTTFGNAIAVDYDGRAWVAGKTTSDTWPATPRTGHFAVVRVGTADAFIARMAANGSALEYMTYINGNSEQEATAIALNHGGKDSSYHVFVAGWTNSPTDFPSTIYLNLATTGPNSRPAVYQKTLTGADDPFVLRLNPFEARPVPDTYTAGVNPLEMVYATHLGATGMDRANALALDDLDDAYIAGWTLSSDWVISTTPPDPVTACSLPCVSFNATPGKLMGNTCAGQTAFAAAIGPTGQYQPFFTYLGATIPGHAATGIAIDLEHGIYVAGYARDADFPLTAGALDIAINKGTGAGAFDGFVTKIAPIKSFGTTACTITGISPNSGYALGGTTVTITGTGFFGFGTGDGVKFDGGANVHVISTSAFSITAISPRHPLTGPLVVGSVPLTVTTAGGTCSKTYNYVLSPMTETGVCVDEYFFPSPVTGAAGNFSYCMVLPGSVSIRVYNVVGDLVAKLENTTGAGAQLLPLNTARLASGVYLYKVEKNYGGANPVGFHESVKKFVVQH